MPRGDSLILTNEYVAPIELLMSVICLKLFMYSIPNMKIVPEDYTSKQCSICGIRHKNGRKHRGLYECKKTGKKINSDINTALNIARRLGHRIRIARKIESYSITHNGIRPLNPCQRANTRDPEIRNPALQGGEGS